MSAAPAPDRVVGAHAGFDHRQTIDDIADRAMRGFERFLGLRNVAHDVLYGRRIGLERRRRTANVSRYVSSSFMPRSIELRLPSLASDASSLMNSDVTRSSIWRSTSLSPRARAQTFDLVAERSDHRAERRIVRHADRMTPHASCRSDRQASQSWRQGRDRRTAAAESARRSIFSPSDATAASIAEVPVFAADLRTDSIASAIVPMRCPERCRILVARCHSRNAASDFFGQRAHFGGQRRKRIVRGDTRDDAAQSGNRRLELLHSGGFARTAAI